MPGSIDYSPQAGDLARDSAAVLVYRYTPSPGGTFTPPTFELLTNVRCLGVAFRKGADPGVARFRYVFREDPDDQSEPSRAEQVYPLDASGPWVVHADDRLCVYAVREDGYVEGLFDGFVQVPQADLDPDSESVSFVALGAPVREWDIPLGGAVYRDADHPTTVSDKDTDLPARMNPDGKPNASPAEADSGESPAKHPVFLGPCWPTNQINGSTVRPWTLSMAARYVIVLGDPDETYVTYGDLSPLDDLLKAVRPADPGRVGFINMDDPSTYHLEDVEVPDVDVAGTAWPVALCALIEPFGFNFAFALEFKDPVGDDPPAPEWGIHIWRDGSTVNVKALHLQPAGDPYDPTLSNVGELALARDTAAVANQIAVDAAPVRVEASLVLAPLFVPASADILLPTAYKLENNPTGADRDKYRLFGFDECGEGHWDFATVATVHTVGDLADVLDMGANTRPFAIRRRPAVRDGKLISVDEKGRPLRPQLHVSNDYKGPAPGVWDGSTGDWQLVVGGWRLLDDRLGIYVTAEDPNSWAIGDGDAADPPFPSGKLNLVDLIAPPAGGGTPPKPPVFRLTVCVDADDDFNVKSKKRAASPTRFTIERRIDARDRFRKTVVSQYSVNNLAGLGTEDTDVTDDEPEAQGYADAQRKANESGVVAGSVTIPRLSTAYRLGDLILGVQGRGLSFRSSAGGEQGETPVYPTVVAVAYEFDGLQSTGLLFSDRRAEPAPKRQRSEEEKS